MTNNKKEVSEKTPELTFGTVHKDVLAEQIVEHLLNMIREKQLRPGDRLPPERELAVTLGVSRPPLREALRALSLMRMIENRQGSGTFVTSLKPELFVEHLDFIFTINDTTLLDLFEARKILEVGLVALAAQNITDQELEEVENCMQQAAECIDDPEAFLKADLELHEYFISAARNNILSLFMNSINDLNIASRRVTGEALTTRQQTLEHHRKIVDAIRAHDPQAASLAMRAHLDHIEERLKEKTSQETEQTVSVEVDK
jgi:GntR family transcriptional regulator, transcriptional repressor for pyruvate dehydrogenase complex